MFANNRTSLFVTTCACALLLGVGVAAAQTTPLVVRPGVALPPGFKVLNPGGRMQIVRPPSGLVRTPGHAHTNVEIVIPRGGYPAMTPTTTGAPPVAGLLDQTPESVACDYGIVAATFGCNPNDTTTLPTGGAKAIAIVDAFDLTSMTTDLAHFDAQFGVPAGTVTKIFGTGSPTVCGNGVAPASAAGTGWDVEEDLDIEYAHAMAPNAHLYLVEAKSSSTTDLINAEQVAATCVANAGGGEISNSWGELENSAETAFDSFFVKSGVVFFASTGDDTFPGWPSTSPNVVAVGGTTLSNNPASGGFFGQAAWFPNPDLFGASSGSIMEGEGAGTSTVEARPSYQAKVVNIVGAHRGVPDVVAVADPDTGVWIYNTLSVGGFTVIGGTSVASPVMAGITNASGNFFSSSNAYLTELYSLGAAKTLQNTYFKKMDSGDCGVPTSPSATGPFKAKYTTNGGGIDPQFQESTIGFFWNECGGFGSPSSAKTLPGG